MLGVGGCGCQWVWMPVMLSVSSGNVGEQPGVGRPSGAVARERDDWGRGSKGEMGRG